jgi:hypothetical protein
MKSVRIGLAVASLGILGAVAQPASALAPKAHHEDASALQLVKADVANPVKIDATKAALRDLWIGHVFWVRNVVVAGLAGDTAAQKAAEKQVVANAQSIAATIEPFYGAPAKEKLFTLLAGHYGAVKNYFDATLATDAKQQGEATTKLTANADEIATFLSGANPNWPKETLMGLLQAHAGHHIAQIQELQAKNYDGEAKTWAGMSQHMYVIADALADGLAKQFPAQF